MKHCLVKTEGRLYVIGAAQYENLVDLINHYQNNPLYNKEALNRYCQQGQSMSDQPGPDGTISDFDEIWYIN